MTRFWHKQLAPWEPSLLPRVFGKPTKVMGVICSCPDIVVMGNSGGRSWEGMDLLGDFKLQMGFWREKLHESRFFFVVTVFILREFINLTVQGAAALFWADSIATRYFLHGMLARCLT